MPHAHAVTVAGEEDREARGLPLPVAEQVKLWLPFDLSHDERRTGCDTRLPAMELKLRVAQCEESLNTIRSYLHSKMHLIQRRNKNHTGQRKTTRAHTLIGRVGDRITMQSKKYNHTCDALMALGGLEEHARRFPVLLPEHLTLDAEELPPDHEASRRMNRAGGGGPRSQKKKKPGESSKVLSWIWVAGSAAEPGGLHDSVRREYLKARARKHRWNEEVVLLVEEMQCVLRFLHWRADWWRNRKYSWDGLGSDISDGMEAYAARQAGLCESIADSFKKQWDEAEVNVVRAAIAATNLEGLEDTIFA
ncbi:hypothetical protein HWV62_24336 [Athelia sp. TMB]|nr:hypothetical protein HWV62_24336 [Athelia sp. TMB]